MTMMSMINPATTPPMIPAVEPMFMEATGKKEDEVEEKEKYSYYNA